MEADRHVIVCPACAKKLAVRAKPGGILKVGCPACSTSFRWRAEPAAEATATPTPPNAGIAQADIDKTKGWPGSAHLFVVLVILTILAVVPLLFASALQDNTLALAIAVLLMSLAAYHSYRAVRVWTGFGGLASVGLLLVACSLIQFVPAQFNQSVLSERLSDWGGERQNDYYQIAEDLEVGDLPPSTENSQESHFRGATPEDISVSEFDDLMEGWGS